MIGFLLPHGGSQKATRGQGERDGSAQRPLYHMSTARSYLAGASFKFS